MRKRVLVAEDDDAIRTFISVALRRAGIDVVSAPDGQVAIELMQQAEFDVIVLDLMMPRVNGHEVLNWIHTCPPENRPRVIVISAAPIREVERIGNVASVLPKPFDLTELIASVRRSLTPSNE